MSCGKIHYDTNELLKESRPIREVIRRMRNGGMLVVGKYNSNNKMTFIALPEMYDAESNDFKEEYLPAEWKKGQYKFEIVKEET